METRTQGYGHLVLLRHGQTAWSQSGQYTGRTDLPLTTVGEQQAITAGQRLRQAFPAGFHTVVVSPLHRAQNTARLAGFADFRLADGLAEYDYGRAEGRTSYAIAEHLGRPWNLWADGTQCLPTSFEGDWTFTASDGQTYPVHNGPGETPSDISTRTAAVITSLLPALQSGHDVLAVAHAHVLRILTTTWLGLDPSQARLLKLDTAHYSVLTRYKGDPIIEHWNC